MTVRGSLKAAVKHPATIVTTGIGALGVILNPSFAAIVVSWFAGHAGVFWSISAVGTFLATNVAGIPVWPFIGLGGVSGVVYAGYKLKGAFGDLRERISR